MPASRSFEDGRNADLAGQIKVAPTNLGFGAASSNSHATALGVGVYRIVADQTCWVRQCSSNVASLTAANGVMLPANWVETIACDGNGDDFVVVLGKGSAGSLCISRK